MRFKRFKPLVVERKDWFNFFLRISPRTGEILWRLEATIDTAARRRQIRRRVRRLIKFLLATSPGVGVVSIFFKTPTGGWWFEKAIKNNGEGLRKLLKELREELVRRKEEERRPKYWDVLQSLLIYSLHATRSRLLTTPIPYTPKEFNSLMNQYRSSLEWRDRILRSITAEGRTLRAKLERLEAQIEALQVQVARRPSSALIRKVGELEEKAGHLRAKINRLRAAYRKANIPSCLFSKRHGGIDWTSWLRYRRFWFKKLCKPGGLRLPPADGGGDVVLRKLAEGLWGEEHQTRKGLRLHYLSQFWE